MANSNFSLVLRMYRMNAGLTQKQVAGALGIERSTYAYYETGSSQPSGLMIIKLSNIFGIDYSLLMDALSDSLSDELPEEENQPVLNDSVMEDRETLYSLKNREQNLVVNFRSLAEEQKTTIEDMIYKMKKDNTEKTRSARKRRKPINSKPSSGGSAESSK